MSKRKQIDQKVILRILLLVPLALTSCRTYLNTTGVSGTSGSGSLTANSIGTGGGTSVTFTAPSGTAYSTVTVDEGAQFLATNVCSTATIFGLTGSARCLASGGVCATAGTNVVVSVDSLLKSGASRTSTATQILMSEEATTYAGADLPTGFRDIPIVTLDDDGGTGSTNRTRLTRGTAVWTGTVPRVVCGMGIATILGRITDCDTRHSTKPSWDVASADGKISWSGAQSGNGLSAEGSWTLVSVYSSSLANGATCDATCLEIWKDDRTGLIWSDRIGSPSSIVVNTGYFNWCIASGNMESATVDCTNGGTGFNTASISLCAEAAGLTTPVGGSSSSSNAAGAAPAAAWGTTGTGIRDAKGGMLKAADSDPAGGGKSPSVRWRLPTLTDMRQADLDGIRLVLPNFYSMGPWMWTATVLSNSRGNAWRYATASGLTSQNTRTTQTFSVRCVGR